VTETERPKPRSMYAEEAIQAALESRWNDAVSVNRTILERHGPDDDTYNRLGKALSELGDLEGALEAYQKTLELNPLNNIAQKNARKLSTLLSVSGKVEGSTGGIDVDLFTEEPGKSALTVLTAKDRGVAVTVNPGDPVELDRKGTGLIARTARGVSLGQVDTKIARRLVPLMTSGNRYTAAVARVEDNRIEIMIREVYQAPENARKSSFPISRGQRREEFRPYTKDSLLASREVDLEPTEDEEELRETAELEEDELEGMQPVEADLEVGVMELDEDVDEDVRPEDHY
jgi:tetratricopeptide (TPR) repeat protein